MATGSHAQRYVLVRWPKRNSLRFPRFLLALHSQESEVPPVSFALTINRVDVKQGISPRKTEERRKDLTTTFLTPRAELLRQRMARVSSIPTPFVETQNSGDLAHVEFCIDLLFPQLPGTALIYEMGHWLCTSPSWPGGGVFYCGPASSQPR